MQDHQRDWDSHRIQATAAEALISTGSCGRNELVNDMGT